MRTFILGVTLTALINVAASAQLLQDAPKDAATDKAGAAAPAADGKQGAAPFDARPAAPQPNAIFAALDADSDGVISKVELRKAIKVLRTLDTDSDGSITLAEASVGSAPAGPGNPLGDDPQIAQFMAYDKNGDGKLTLNEVPREMAAMLQGVDQNGDRAIDRNELSVAMANLRNRFGGGPWQNNGLGGPPRGARNDQQATGQFLQYDRNADGKLTPDELPQQAAGMLRDADTDGDGAINAGELQAAMEKMGGRARGLRAGLAPDANHARNGIDRDRKRAGNER